MKNFQTTESQLKRLKHDYFVHNDIIVAFDFDNTVYDFHDAGLFLDDTINALQVSHRLGLSLFCFTANNNEQLVADKITEIFGKHHGIQINESRLDHLFGGRKPFYSILLDDRAGLGQALEVLKGLNAHVRQTLIHP